MNHTNPAPLQPEQNGSVSIENAGLVLLSPFINSLFGELGYVNDGQFNRPEAAQRAVHLLQYLATGTKNAPESQLMLNKLLCGLKTDQPVRQLALVPEERNEAEKLLKAVVHHWNAIKNISNTGLREAFLQRTGKLEWVYDSVYLTVEVRSLDMLLESLPWGISFIYLPWMEKPLWVQWQ